MKYFILFVQLLMFNVAICAQHIIAEQMPFFYQLSSNEIWDINQDKDGYLWISTTNGLARYDGYKLQFFRSDYKHPDLLTNNSIGCIADNGSYVWIGTGKGVNLFDKKTYRITPFPDADFSDKHINGIIVDKDGFSWIAAAGKLYKCDSTAYIIKEYAIPNIQHTDNPVSINSVYADNKGNVWALAWKGLFRYDPSADTFINYPPFGEQNAPFTMFQDESDNYWIGTWGEGLWQFFPEKAGEQCYKRHHIISSKDGQSEPIIFSMTQDDSFGYLWALSYNELYALKHTPDGKLEQIDIQDLLDTHMMFTRIFKDRNGNLWLSSYDMAYTIFFDNSKIDNYPLHQLKERLGWDANIVNLCRDENNMMWINQDRYSLCLYDLQADMLSYPELLEVTIIEKAFTEKGVWVSDRSSYRIMRLTQHQMKIKIEEDLSLNQWVDNPGGVRQLQEDRNGNLWIFTSNHLLVKPVNEQFVIPAGNDQPVMSCLTTDPEMNIWAVSSDQHVYKLKYANNRIACEQHSSVPSLSKSDGARFLCIDKEGCFWIISSLGRIYRSNSQKDIFDNIPLENEIEDCTVLKLIADHDNVWIVTNKKVIRYNISENSLSDYSTSDGNIQVNVFRHRATSPDGNGGLYIGGHGGFVHIQSETPSLYDGRNVHPAITDVRVNNTSILFNQTKQVNTTDQVFLNPDDRNIEISYSLLQYSLDPKIKVAYKLDGIDRDWVYPDYTKNVAFYNQLKKGSYKFRMKFGYEQNRWNGGEVLLTIEQHPAFYETWYAYLFYALFIGLCGYLILFFYLQRIRTKNNIRFKEELNRTKLDYFTNVSHELLTPLTVISTAVDHLETRDVAGNKQTVILKSNVHRLKQLIQQILDFRKMDMGRMVLNVSYGNIQDFILNICQTNFAPLAQKKNIALQVIQPDVLYGYLDFDKLDKMLYNLLSNAIKYTPEQKQIKVLVQVLRKEEHEYLSIKVQDEGIGISPKETEQIFARFYNNRKSKGVESNGIGLSLTKDLITLHHGTIAVESMPEKGSCFTLKLPIDKAYYTADELMDELENPDAEEAEVANLERTESSGDTNKFTLLLVDDNIELLYIMKEVFKEKYVVATATNGLNAWEKINNQAVDVVVCDVMMPDMNGWELCNRIKTDLRFNHIPVIILTARKEIDDRVASYEAGADGYIAKPFELKVLFARVDNLIKSCKTRQDAFRKEDNVSLQSMSDQSADKQFLQSIIDSIEQHLDESEFDLEQLSVDLHISKSTLHRKIKLITGFTPLDFVRNIKMKRACMMLATKNQTISEVAYAVGFNNPKYFTKCFKEEFGTTPSEYQQTHS